VASKKGGKKKTVSAAQVAASSKGDAPRAPPPHLTALRCFFSSRSQPTPQEDSSQMATVLPDIMAGVLKQAGCTLQLSFAVFVNCNGAVTLTFNPGTPFSAYSPSLSS